MCMGDGLCAEDVGVGVGEGGRRKVGGRGRAQQPDRGGWSGCLGQSLRQKFTVDRVRKPEVQKPTPRSPYVSP